MQTLEMMLPNLKFLTNSSTLKILAKKLNVKISVLRGTKIPHKEIIAYAIEYNHPLHTIYLNNNKRVSNGI